MQLLLVPILLLAVESTCETGLVEGLYRKAKQKYPDHACAAMTTYPMKGFFNHRKDYPWKELGSGCGFVSCSVYAICIPNHEHGSWLQPTDRDTSQWCYSTHKFRLSRGRLTVTPPAS
ncbi:hypothetical protein DSO57_1018328 [Entomophthora muscae]|uniref:Uncharacterized protein n=1 Tax=Entomophthora muscae TaxID=34485 RepID=A0ACC2RVE4_9FUNG|nr:hypothetical protein DSO57_1018328 [Entomophthora muscae]